MFSKWNLTSGDPRRVPRNLAPTIAYTESEQGQAAPRVNGLHGILFRKFSVAQVALLIPCLVIGWIVPPALVVMAPGLCVMMHGLTRDAV
jgi:hypothetical protein